MTMDPIVTNTGPLIALSQISALPILKDLFSAVIVPLGVHKEMIAEGKIFTDQAIYQKCDWIQVVQPETPLDPLLVNILDYGEASVIHVARELNIPGVLMDEKKGRKIARDIYGLKVMGTARILLNAKRNGLIDSVREMLEEMRSRGYWIHERIIERAANEAGE
jgi:uncharacterized protein